MEKHAKLLKPKFDLFDSMLKHHLGSRNLYASWNNPKGGYFISFNTKPYLAREVIKLANEAGVTLTHAGATFPYLSDPHDSNIRIAPSQVKLSEIRIAAEILAITTKIATINKYGSNTLE